MERPKWAGFTSCCLGQVSGLGPEPVKGRLHVAMGDASETHRGLEHDGCCSKQQSRPDHLYLHAQSIARNCKRHRVHAKGLVCAEPSPIASKEWFLRITGACLLRQAASGRKGCVPELPGGPGPIK